MRRTNASVRVSRQGRGVRSGFSLIELIVVMALTLIITTAGVTLFIATLRSSARSTNLSTLKDEGDYAASQIEFALRNARQVVPNPTADPTPVPCSTTPTTSLSIEGIDQGITTFELKNGQIASVSAGRGQPTRTLYLTSTGVIPSPNPLSFTCVTSRISGTPYITASFDLTKDPGSGKVTTQSFSTSVQLRNAY